jgi:DNA-directed RNA polymerase alpha subunit
MKNIINKCLQRHIKFGILQKDSKKEGTMNTDICKKILHQDNAKKQYSSEEKTLSIQCLEEFLPRHYNILKQMNIQTIDELSHMTTFDLIENPKFQNQNPRLLIRAVHLLGYSFQDEQLTEAAAKVRTRSIKNIH